MDSESPVAQAAKDVPDEAKDDLKGRPEEASTDSTMGEAKGEAAGENKDGATAEDQKEAGAEGKNEAEEEDGAEAEDEDEEEDEEEDEAEDEDEEEDEDEAEGEDKNHAEGGGKDAAEEGKGGLDLADTGIAAETAAEGAPSSTQSKPPARPVLRREQSQPQPPPPGSQQADSLSLAQLRQIVSEFPKTDTVAYDFEYKDTGPHAEEIDEWFVYHFWQWVRLRAVQEAFESQWNSMDEDRLASWEDASAEARAQFVLEKIKQVKSTDDNVRAAAVACITYLVLGRWAETAGSPSLPARERSKLRSLANPNQLAAMKQAVKLVATLDGLPALWSAFRNALDVLWSVEDTQKPPEGLQEVQDELNNLMTTIYITIQQTINDRAEMADVRSKLVELDPNIASFMLGTVARMRWIDGTLVPMTQTFLLLWKSLLVIFGGTDEIEETKKALRENSIGDDDKEIITASPLDYHVFRQEISSKYPAYIPPQLPIPLEADSTSLLPPLPNHPTRNNGSNGILPAPPNTQSGGASILHQPVHIATPAPSPPPSPGPGGKGGKKQNYQTNQNFPFMYPPLDASSNGAGGKGSAALQDVLVGRKWEGSDIPTSIKEAGELFSGRVRMTRAIRQLWEEREKFLKFERGWDATDEDLEDLDLDSLTLGDGDNVDDDKLLEVIERRTAKSQQPEIDYGPNANVDDTIKQRLDAVERFYDDALPQLQSVVMVLMKAVLYSVTSSLALPQSRLHETDGPMSGMPQYNADSSELTLEELDQMRAREIEGKALTGTIILLLKWFKISHVLKFEYLTQLLLDSNYLPLVLKLFAHQDVQQVVDSKTDRLDQSFFHYCNDVAERSRGGPAAAEATEAKEPEGQDDDSSDEAAPPPIKRRKSPPRPSRNPFAESDEAETEEKQGPVRPEVDELGYPINPLPMEPITDFSRRNLYSLISYLRILQKMCKNKIHRNLLLVQYKSSHIIRKALRVPQPQLRLYTLKLFKNQVPYCGRKWRQSNMRVITAVYLHCRPELRDEWLAGSDVDAEVEEALPLEQALRSLTHWFNVRRYPDRVAPDVGDALRAEQDFFRRELEKIEVPWPGPGPDQGGEMDWEQVPSQGGSFY